MHNAKLNFALAGMIKHYETNDASSQSFCAAFIHAIKPQLTPEQAALVNPIYDRTIIANLESLGKSGWVYRNWSLVDIGLDISKQIDSMDLTATTMANQQRVTEFVLKHNLTVTA